MYNKSRASHSKFSCNFVKVKMQHCRHISNYRIRSDIVQFFSIHHSVFVSILVRITVIILIGKASGRFRGSSFGLVEPPCLHTLLLLLLLLYFIIVVPPIIIKHVHIRTTFSCLTD